MSGTAPIIVSALFGPEDFAAFDWLRRTHFPPERNLIDAHLTLFHHLPPALEDEVKLRLARAVDAPPPPAMLAGVMSLGRGTALRIESEGLERIRSDLAEAFAGMLTPQDSGGWRPHVTVQNKVAPSEARALKQALDADLRPRPVRIAGLASWWYRDGPWEPLSRHMFRG